MNIITKISKWKIYTESLQNNNNLEYTNKDTDEYGNTIANCLVCKLNGVLLDQHKHTTPDPIPSDAKWWTENDIFVFGSNDLGQHLGGAAKAAVLFYGAIMGQARGLQGNSYGIVTLSFKNDPNIGLETIASEVDTFIQYAKDNPNKRFWMTKIGLGIAKIDPKFIIDIFLSREFPENVILPKEFIKYK